jgi:DNA repair exonuclease SbcCD ATPase subunit
VIFLDSHILGFGKLRDFSIEFQKGVNLVFAANEGGKSTLQRFLVALLYGQLRSDLKVQRRLDSWVERYKPWYGQEYGGMLRCRLADNRDLEIRRSFGKDENRTEIRTSTGEDITKQYEQQRNGEILFAKYHFGITKELFESVGIIRENRASEIRSRETIRDRIANLAHSGDEELSIRQSIAQIEEMLDSVGSERAPTKPYKQAMDLVRDLQEERKAFLERREQFQGWLADRNSLAGEVQRMDSELSRIRISLLKARHRDVAARIESLEDINGDISSLRERIETLGAREDFPTGRLEELNQLVGARDRIEERLEEVRAKKEESLSQLARAESDRRELEAYALLAENAESERITELFVSYMSLSLQKDGLKKTFDHLRNETEVLEKRLGRLCAALRDSKDDWQSFAREAAEDERIASQRCSVLADNALRERTKLADGVRTAFNLRLVAVLLLIIAVSPFVVGYTTGFEALTGWFGYGIAAGSVMFSLWLWLAAGKSANKGREAKQRIHALELEQDEVRKEGAVKRKELDEVIVNSGFQGLGDFLAAAKGSEQDRLRLADLEARLREVELQNHQQQEQSEETYRMLKDGLAKVGLSCSPGNLKFQIDTLRNNLRRFRELDAQYSRCRHETDSLAVEEKRLEEEYGQKFSQIKSLLDQAGVDTPQRFREECSKRKNSIELSEKVASHTREFGRLAEGRTLQQWKEALIEIEKQQKTSPPEENSIGENQTVEPGSDVPYLPYIPSVAELEEKERLLSSRLSDARQEHARAVERVNRAFENFRPLSEIDEDLVVAEKKLEELGRNREALSIALDTIEKLSRQQQEVLAPQLNAAVEQRFLRLCERRYEEVKIDPDFQVWLRETDTGELRSVDHLSRGTQDQLYFAIRFGILDLVSNPDEPSPCLLDEPFAAYDRPRLHEAFNILVEESALRQLILLTCREDLLAIAGQHNVNIIRI